MAHDADSARPTPKMIRLYHQLVAGLGEPEDLWVFDPTELPQPNKLRLTHVPVWPADESRDVTLFNTLGMSERRMQGADYFTELHFAVRSALDKDQRLQVARFLADVAEYPFQNNLKLDWWELINPGRPIPAFSGCKHLLLHPRLAPDGTDTLDDPDGPVKLLYLVPITPAERQLLLTRGRSAFLRQVEDNEIDLLQDRQDAAETTEQPGKPRRILCPTHGESDPCMICRHLREAEGLGYFLVKVNPGQDFFETAMCKECDELFWAENGWTHRLFDFADWKLFCRHCFEERRGFHRLLGTGRLAPDKK
jgi:hypothetical protein